MGDADVDVSEPGVELNFFGEADASSGSIVPAELFGPTVKPASKLPVNLFGDTADTATVATQEEDSDGESTPEVDDMETEALPSPAAVPVAKAVDPRHARAPSRVREARAAAQKTTGKQMTSSKKPSRKSVPTATRVASIKTKKNGEPVKKRKFKPATVAKREIAKYERSNELLIPKAPFERLVRELLHEARDHDTTRLTADALVVLHEVAEHFMTVQMKKYNEAAAHRGRITIKTRDIRHVQKMEDPNSWHYSTVTQLRKKKE